MSAESKTSPEINCGIGAAGNPCDCGECSPVASGPFIVTTTKRVKNPFPPPRSYEHVDYRAVATLEEARSEARDISLRHDDLAAAQRVQHPAWAGGTITCPDGTVIEVKPYSYSAMLATTPTSRTNAEIIAAYNAAQES